jgi:16S rRNA (cytosine967-C5)-methyltransferase
MIAQNARTVTTLRVNTLVTNRETLLSQLKNDGAEAFESELCDDGINLKSGAVASLYGFDSGHFFVQDDSSRLCVEALAPEEGETVLDACACPGGKSFASAIRMKNIGKIVSCDLHESKLSLITGGAERLGIGIIDAVTCDSSVYRPEWNEKFDRVLCDVPCSGYGTIAKKPDLRLKKPESASSLADVQLNIACNCARYLKKGGTMVYSTCTLNPKENEENVKRFLEENKDFELISMTTKFPYEGLCDGFFFAKMIKK